MSTPKLKEIADRINAHLKRMEANPTINKNLDQILEIPAYYFAGACVYRRRVVVQYSKSRGCWGFKKPEALAYLEWLDAGNNGKHYDMEREKEK